MNNEEKKRLLLEKFQNNIITLIIGGVILLIIIIFFDIINSHKTPVETVTQEQIRQATCSYANMIKTGNLREHNTTYRNYRITWVYFINDHFPNGYIIIKEIFVDNSNKKHGDLIFDYFCVEKDIKSYIDKMNENMSSALFFDNIITSGSTIEKGKNIGNSKEFKDLFSLAEAIIIVGYKNNLRDVTGKSEEVNKELKINHGYALKFKLNGY